jgi:acetylglutamate kinase
LDLGFVGEIRSVNTGPIQEALDSGVMPVVSSTGSDHLGQCYNINADTAAAQIAIALHARRLVYLSDVPGLLRNPDDPSTLLSSLAVDQVEPLKNQGIIAQGMLPKVNSAVDALNAGVNRVHLIDGRLAHSILLEIFTDEGIGTEIIHSESNHE